MNLVVSRQLLVGTDGLPGLPLLLGLKVLEAQPSLQLCAEDTTAVPGVRTPVRPRCLCDPAGLPSAAAPKVLLHSAGTGAEGSD